MPDTMLISDVEELLQKIVDKIYRERMVTIEERHEQQYLNVALDSIFQSYGFNIKVKVPSLFQNNIKVIHKGAAKVKTVK